MRVSRYLRALRRQKRSRRQVSAWRRFRCAPLSHVCEERYTGKKWTPVVQRRFISLDIPQCWLLKRSTGVHVPLVAGSLRAPGADRVCCAFGLEGRPPDFQRNPADLKVCGVTPS